MNTLANIVVGDEGYLGDFYWLCRLCPCQGKAEDIASASDTVRQHLREAHPHEHGVCQHVDCSVRICVPSDPSGPPCVGGLVPCIHGNIVCPDHAADIYSSGGCPECRIDYLDDCARGVGFS
jgi:hypothetical protein